MIGEVGEFWNDVNKIRKKKREDNRNNSSKILSDKNINFHSKNYGAHLIIEHNNHQVDFWPGTGRYIFRREEKKGFGVFNLIKDLRK